MDWLKFKKRFGTNTTNNIQLINWAKQLKIKPFYYAMRDEIKDLPQYGNFIVNIHTSDQRGVHHSAIYSEKNKVIFFDSYGLPPTKEILEKFNHTKNRLYGDAEEQFQQFNKKYCGQASLYFLYKNKNGVKFENILKEFKLDEGSPSESHLVERGANVPH